MSYATRARWLTAYRSAEVSCPAQRAQNEAIQSPETFTPCRSSDRGPSFRPCKKGIHIMHFVTTRLAGTMLALLALASCTHWVHSLPSTTAFDGKSEEAIIVLKVEPAGRVSMVPGTLDRSGWRMSPGVSSYGSWAEDGTIIIKVKPRVGSETYGITVVTPDDGRYARYHATRGASVATFHAVAGQVTFVGAIRIERSEVADALTISHNEAPDDGEMVKQLVRRRYPRVRANVVTEIFDMYPRADEPTTSGSLLAAPFRDD